MNNSLITGCDTRLHPVLRAMDRAFTLHTLLDTTAALSDALAGNGNATHGVQTRIEQDGYATSQASPTTRSLRTSPPINQLYVALFDATKNACVVADSDALAKQQLSTTALRRPRTCSLMIHITGKAKWKQLSRVIASPATNHPISLLLDNYRKPKHVYWTR